MNKKKRMIYIIAAVVLIIAGLYLEHNQTGNDGDVRGSEENYAVENGREDLADADVQEETVIDTSQETASTEQTEQLTDVSVDQETSSETLPEDYVAYYFRNDNLLEQHYEKHGMEMGFESMEAYEEAACAVIYHPDVLTKTEEEDGDYVYYVEESNEFVSLSPDGYIRTYFNPSAGIDYFNRQ